MAKILKSNILAYLKEKTYLKAKIDELLSAKAPNNHASSSNTYGVGSTSNYGHVKTVNNLTTASYADGLVLAANQGKVLKDAVDGKATSEHGHGNITKDGVISNQKSKNVVTDSNGKITTEDKLVVDTALANSTNLVQNKAVKNALDSINGSSIKLNNSSNLSVSDAVSDKVDKISGKGLSTNDFTDALKAKLDAIEAQANKYSHPTSHATSMIVEASALANIGSAANATQHTVNTNINSALGKKVDKVTGKGLSTNDFTDDLKTKLESTVNEFNSVTQYKLHSKFILIKKNRLVQLTIDDWDGVSWLNGRTGWQTIFSIPEGFRPVAPENDCTNIYCPNLFGYHLRVRINCRNNTVEIWYDGGDPDHYFYGTVTWVTDD